MAEEVFRCFRRPRRENNELKQYSSKMDIHCDHDTICTKKDDPNYERQRDSEALIPRMSKKLPMTVYNANYADFEDK